MTKRLVGHVFSRELEKLAKKPLNQADSDALVHVARAFWYSNVSLEAEFNLFMLKARTEVELRRAGYLVERLTRFSCVSKSRLSEASQVLTRVGNLRRDRVQHADRKAGRTDMLAMRWGLDEGLGVRVQALMPFQTRHFESTQRQTA